MSGRMVGPWIYLTIGNMFENSPGFLTGITVSTGQETTWETADNYKLPKHISVDCTFKYVGKYPLMTTGKHYDLNDMDGHKTFGNFAKSPQRTASPSGNLGATQTTKGQHNLKALVNKIGTKPQPASGN